MKTIKKSLAWACVLTMLLSVLGTMEVSARPKLQTLAPAGQNLIINGDFESEDEITRNANPDPVLVPQTWRPLTNAIITSEAASTGSYGLKMTSSVDESSLAVFDFIHVALAPHSTYSITADIKGDNMPLDANFVNSTGEVNIVSSGFSITGAWRNVTMMTFTTGSDYVYGSVKLSIYKGAAGSVYLDNVNITANGNEWCSTPEGVVTMPRDEHGNLYSKTNPFTDEFDDPTLDLHKWLVSATAWGGDNGGLAAANVAMVTEDGRSCVRLESHGEQYEGNIKGSGGVITRVGAGIVTRPYFASGEYEVVAKIENTLGVCRAFWSFSYIGYMQGDDEFYDGTPATEHNLHGNVRNSEIDWEFPSAYNDNRPDDAITLNILRTNCWGGKRPGEGGEFSRRSNPDNNPTLCIADGQFHVFTYVWCAVNDREDPYKSNAYLSKADMAAGRTVDKSTGRSSVTWYIDGVMVNTYDMNDEQKWNAGQADDLAYPAGQAQLGKYYADGGYGINTPYRGTRFWIADWFPVNSGKGDLFPAGEHRYTGWAGTPDYDTCYTYIDSCTIKPYYQTVEDDGTARMRELGIPGDEYNYREDVPNKDFVTPIEYPNWQKANGLLEYPIPITAIDGGNVTVTWDSVAGATAYDMKFDGQVYQNVQSGYVVTGLPIGQHTVQLRSKKPGETSCWSYEGMCCIGVPDLTPERLSVDPAKSQIIVEWPEVENAVDYYLEIDNCPQLNQNTEAYYSFESGVPSPRLQGLAPGTHIIRVRSQGTGGMSNWSRACAVQVPQPTLPIPGLISKRSDVDENTYQLIVNEGNGYYIGETAEYYEIVDANYNRITDAGGQDVGWIKSRRYGGGGNYYAITQVTLGNGIYTYYVRSYDADTNTYSPWSAPIEIYNGLATQFTPPGIKAYASETAVDMYWSDSSEGGVYNVTYDLEEDGVIVLSNVTTTTFQKDGFETGSTHYYRVRTHYVDLDYTTDWSTRTFVEIGGGGGGGGGGGQSSGGNNSGTILNGGFDTDTSYWSLAGAVRNENGTVTLTPTETDTATLTQVVGGCLPNTTYTVAGDFTSSGVSGYMYIRGATASEISIDLSKNNQYTFTTGETVGDITFIVSVYKQQNGTLTCDNLSLSVGNTPTAPPSTEPQPTQPSQPTQSSKPSTTTTTTTKAPTTTTTTQSMPEGDTYTLTLDVTEESPRYTFVKRTGNYIYPKNGTATAVFKLRDIWHGSSYTEAQIAACFNLTANGAPLTGAYTTDGDTLVGTFTIPMTSNVTLGGTVAHPDHQTAEIIINGYEGGETPTTTTTQATTYAVTVENGHADVTAAAAGQAVSVTANVPQTGYAFNGWQVKVNGVAAQNPAALFGDINALSTSFTMQAGDVTLTATYRQVEYAIGMSLGTAKVNGNVASTAHYGDTVTITANTPAAGMRFTGWSVKSGSVVLADATKSTTTFSMPAQDISIEATYDFARYSVIVNNGAANKETAITGDLITLDGTAQTGYEFVSWTVNSNNVTLSSVTDANATFTMPAADVEITANYKQTDYTLTLSNATASKTTGLHFEDVVTITANAPAAGFVFDKWVVSAGGAEIVRENDATTTFIMPPANVTIAATYKLASYSVTVSGGKAYKNSVEITEAKAGEVVTIVATVPGGKEFVSWTGVNTLENAASATTTFTMPAQDVILTASFRSLVVDPSAPPVPTMRAAVVDGSSVVVNWTAVSGAEGYRIYRKAGDGAWTAVKTLDGGAVESYTDTALLRGEYHYTVQAYVTGSTGKIWSDYEEPGALATVTFGAPQLTGAVASATGITITWNKVSGASGYRLYRKDGDNWTTVKTLADGEVTSYVAKGLIAGTTYTYTVQAYADSVISGARMWSDYDQVGVWATATFGQSSSDASVTGMTITITWEPVQGAEGYRIYRKTANTPWRTIATADAPATQYTDANPVANVVYVYTVQAYTTEGGKRIYSAYDLTGTTAGVTLSAPVLTAAEVTEEGVVVSWEQTNGATGYRLYRWNGSKWKTVKTVSGQLVTSFTDRSASARTGAKYTVQAFRTTDGVTAWSDHDATGVTAIA